MICRQATAYYVKSISRQYDSIRYLNMSCQNDGEIDLQGMSECFQFGPPIAFLKRFVKLLANGKTKKSTT